MSSQAFIAREEDAGMRLDAAMVSRGAAGSRAQAQKSIEAGLVTVDGQIRRSSHRMVAGETVAVGAPERKPAERAGETDIAFAVVYEDPHLMVVDKPAGVVVHPGAGRSQGTLVQALGGRAAGGADPDRPGIVHRLDRDTSGLLIVARSHEAHAALTLMMRERRIRREYLALVEGRPDARSGTIDAPIGRDRDHRTLMSTRTDKARQAVTHFEVLETLPRTALLGVRLQTGRTHQIRAHMAAIGHRVCGDERYGGATSGRRLGLTRQFLHSRKLTFTHPVSGELKVCKSRTPVDLLQSLEVARREPAPGGPDGGGN